MDQWPILSYSSNFGTRYVWTEALSTAEFLIRAPGYDICWVQLPGDALGNAGE